MAACNGDKPYADHAAHECVAQCPPGQTPDADKDCQGVSCLHLFEWTALGDDAPVLQPAPTTSLTRIMKRTSVSHSALLDEEPTQRTIARVTPSNEPENVHSPDTSVLAVCVDDAPYADHSSHACVSQCPSGQAPDDQKDCQSKLYYTKLSSMCCCS